MTFNNLATIFGDQFRLKKLKAHVCNNNTFHYLQDGIDEETIVVIINPTSGQGSKTKNLKYNTYGVTISLICLNNLKNEVEIATKEIIDEINTCVNIVDGFKYAFELNYPVVTAVNQLVTINDNEYNSVIFSIIGSFVESENDPSISPIIVKFGDKEFELVDLLTYVDTYSQEYNKLMAIDNPYPEFEFQDKNGAIVFTTYKQDAPVALANSFKVEGYHKDITIEHDGLIIDCVCQQVSENANTKLGVPILAFTFMVKSYAIKE